MGGGADRYRVARAIAFAGSLQCGEKIRDQPVPSTCTPTTSGIVKRTVVMSRVAIANPVVGHDVDGFARDTGAPVGVVVLHAG